MPYEVRAHSDRPASPRDVADDDIRRQLRRVVDSAALRHSMRLTAFLRFVVEMALAGQTERIKSYTIAVEALGRDASFDPQRDPIVRVGAGRLRRALERYYGGEGRHDPITIELPRGTYVPHFHWRRTDHHPSPAFGPQRWTDIAAGSDDLIHLLAAIQQVLDLQLAQAGVVADVIASARQTLERSRVTPQPASIASHSPLTATRRNNAKAKTQPTRMSRMPSAIAPATKQ